jgi:PKHD-type hydroxylase
MDNHSLSEDQARVAQGRNLTEGRSNYFLVGPPCFDQEQIQQLKTIVDQESQTAEVGEAGQESVSGGHYQDGRRTQVRSLKFNDCPWVYKIIEACFTTANQFMRLDIVPSMNDPIQLLRYDADVEGHFRWHADTLPNDMTRKISIVVPLSHPNEYEGGQFQVNQGGVLSVVNQVAGRPVAFPSWLIHQVTPVTVGHRYSLVAWIRGPNWR